MIAASRARGPTGRVPSGCSDAFRFCDDGTRRLRAEWLWVGNGPVAKLIYEMSKSAGNDGRLKATHPAKGSSAQFLEYIAGLGPEPADEMAPPHWEPAVGQKGFPSGPPPQWHEPPGAQRKRRATARQPKSQPAAPPNRILKRRRGQLANESYEGPPGVQGANVGYWQAGGATRAGAKRSKRP